MPRWRGWPAKHTQYRKWLDAIYWADDPPRKVEEGWYLYPTIFSETAISPLALWRDAHTDDRDRDTRRVFDFAAGWAQWRARLGDSLEARLKRRTFIRKRNDLDFPPPSAMLLYAQRLPR